MTVAKDQTRYASSPWQISRGGWWRILKRTASHIEEHRLMLTSAGVAFYGFLSLFPALAALVFIYGLVTDIGSLQKHIALLSAVLPAQAVDVIAERLSFVVKDQNAQGIGLGLILSLAISFWSGSRGVAAMVEVIGLAYRQPDKRSLVYSAGLSLVLTLGMLMMLIFTLLAIAGIPAITNLLVLPPYFESLMTLVRWPVMLVAVVLCLIALYRLAPDRRMAKLRWTVPGAVAATILWGVMSLGLSVYVEYASDYESTFGALSSIVLLMLWMNYSVLIITLGAELNAELELATRIDTTIAPNMPMGRRGAFVADNINTG